MEKLMITNDCETVTIFIDPIKHPNAFRRAKLNLMESGLTGNEAERHLLMNGFEMEMFVKEDAGLFLVESEAIDSTPIYCPYTSEEILYTENLPNFYHLIETDNNFLKEFQSLTKENFMEIYGKSSEEYDNTMKIYLYKNELK